MMYADMQFPHPATFIEALPGQHIRVGSIVAFEVRENTVGIMVATQATTVTLAHQFDTAEEAAETGEFLLELLQRENINKRAKVQMEQAPRPVALD